MPPKTKSDTDKPLLGQPDSVMRPDYLLAVQEGNLDTDILPFSGPLQLPTSEQILKLYFFIREQLGKKNTKVSQDVIANKVCNLVAQYWNMAGYKTVVKFRVVKHIKKELEMYQKINKSRGRSTAAEVEKRELYLKGLKRLFDIAAPDLEDEIQKSRILGNDDECTRYRVKEGYTRKTEDLSFLIDQRGERKMVMGMKDTSYEERVETNLQRKLNETVSVAVKPGDLVSRPEANNNDAMDEESDGDQENDKDYTSKIRYN